MLREGSKCEKPKENKGGLGGGKSKKGKKIMAGGEGIQNVGGGKDARAVGKVEGGMKTEKKLLWYKIGKGWEEGVREMGDSKLWKESKRRRRRGAIRGEGVRWEWEGEEW